MSHQFYAPLDPECPEVREYVDTLLDDPMTEAMGAPVDEILEAFERKHRQQCQRCRDYGLENIEIR